MLVTFTLRCGAGACHRLPRRKARVYTAMSRVASSDRCFIGGYGAVDEFHFIPRCISYSEPRQVYEIGDAFSNLAFPSGIFVFSISTCIVSHDAPRYLPGDRQSSTYIVFTLATRDRGTYSHWWPIATGDPALRDTWCTTTGNDDKRWHARKKDAHDDRRYLSLTRGYRHASYANHGLDTDCCDIIHELLRTGNFFDDIPAFSIETLAES